MKEKQAKCLAILLAVSMTAGMAGPAAAAEFQDTGDLKYYGMLNGGEEQPGGGNGSESGNEPGGEGTVALTVYDLPGEAAVLEQTVSAGTVIDGGPATLLRATVDGEVVVDNSKQSGGGEDLPHTYTVPAEADAVEVEFGYQLVVTTWYTDYREMTAPDGWNMTQARIEACQVDPEAYPAQTCTYVISPEADQEATVIQPEEGESPFTRAYMRSEFLVIKDLPRGNYKREYALLPGSDGDVEITNGTCNAYRLMVSHMTEDASIQWPVSLFEAELYYAPMLEQVDGSYRYVYDGQDPEHPDAWANHAKHMQAAVDGTEIEPFGAAPEGYRYSYGQVYAWASGFGEHIYRFGSNDTEAWPNISAERLEEFMGLTIDGQTGEFSGPLHLRDTVRYDINQEYKLIRPVLYEANDGSGRSQRAEYVRGETVAVGENPYSYDGYRFTGWNTAADGSGVSYKAGDVFEMGAVESVTLYAQWEKSGGGTDPVDPVPTPDTDDDDDDDDPVPTPTPEVELPEEEVPLDPGVDIPEETTPLTPAPEETPDRPADPAQEGQLEVPEEETPLGDLPQTGMSAAPVDPAATAGLVAMAFSMAGTGLFLTFGRKKDEEE